MTDSDADASPPVSPRRRRLIWILVSTGTVLALGAASLVAYGSAVAANAAAEQATVEHDAYAAAIRDAVLARSDAYTTTSEARDIVTSAGNLIDDEGRSDALTSVETLEAQIDERMPVGGDVDEIAKYTAEFAPLVEAVGSALLGVRDAALARATDRLAADALATADRREDLIAALAALEDAEPSAELLAALLAAVEAADTSHANATSTSGSGASGGEAGGGSAGGSGGGGHTGGSGGGGTSTPPPPPPPPPPYTDADAVASVQARYGGQAGIGTGAGCLALNWGTWGRTGTPPPPRMDLIAAGGLLAFKAWSTGSGGEVHYYACY